MRVMIVGAGVIGSVYGAHLAQAGHEVSVWARGRRLDDLRADGLTVEDVVTKRRITSKVRVVESLAADEVYDLILVAMRKNQVTDEVLAALAANACSSAVLFMVNTTEGYDHWSSRVGRERFIAGFPNVGGVKCGALVSYTVVPASLQSTTLGEISGRRTERLANIARALQQAGFAVSMCGDMAAWQRTHVAWIIPLAAALYAAGGDVVRLAYSRELLTLVIAAVREHFRALAVLGTRVTPRRLLFWRWVPATLLRVAFRRLLASELGKLAVEPHANAARDEMLTLANELRSIVLKSGVPAPASHRLYEIAFADLAKS